MLLLAPDSRRAMSAERPTRSPCETCGGTGRMQGGDEQDWTTCPDCEPDGKTSDLTGLTGAIGWGLDPTGSTKDPLLDAKIHDVTIVKVLAEGGMGRVYLGQEDPPLERKVAVKIIKPGYASPEAISRLEQEAALLALLDHQYIADVYRAGFHDCDGGRIPYFVMQYIKDALPLTTYADKHGKSLSERLDLFRKVCGAVAYGHAMKPTSVVHRDLKPSNILVDRNGDPKVIDFGIARCIDTDPAVDTGLTTAGRVLGTPQYMSPEQFRSDRSAIDSRTDVWALGAILHEFMAGKPPYDVRGLSGYEAAHVVWQYRPAWSEELTARLGQPLLDVIARCLRQDRDERFADAGALLAGLATLRVGDAAALASSESAVATTPVTARPSVERRTALLAGGAVAAIGAAALLNIKRWLDIVRPEPGPPKPHASVYPFAFNGRRYAIFLVPVTHAEAVAEAERRGGRMARIDTTAVHRKIVQVATETDCGPVYLWVDRNTTGSRIAGRFPVIPTSPGEEDTTLDGGNIVGGFVCDLGE